MRTWMLALIIAIVIILGLGQGALAQTPTPPPAPTPTPAPPSITKIEGKITAVDTTGAKVTIAPEIGTAITLNITSSTEIEVPGKAPATLADLKVGQEVRAKYETGTKNVLETEVKEVKPAKIQGEITALDAATKKVTITPKPGQPVVLTVTNKTKVEVWGKEPAGFTDLKVGDQVKAEYNPTSAAVPNEALEIEVKGKAEPPQAVRQGYFGTVKAKTGTSLSLETKQGDVTITLDANTQYWNPPRKDATLADVKVGDRVAVLAVKPDTTLVARRVLVLPTKPVRLQITGSVSQVEGSIITVTDKEGKTYTMELPHGLAAKVQVGDLLSVTLLQTPGVEKYVASGLMRAEEILDRLQSLREKVKTRKAETEEEKGKRTKDLEKLEGLIQSNMERQQETLKKVLDKVPPQAKEAIEKAMERHRQSWERVKEVIEKEKGKPAVTPSPGKKPERGQPTGTPTPKERGKS